MFDRVATLREVLLVLFIPFVALALFLIPVWFAQVQNHNLLIQSCVNAEANRTELYALRTISIELGLPARFPIPRRTAECMDALQDGG